MTFRVSCKLVYATLCATSSAEVQLREEKTGERISIGVEEAARATGLSTRTIWGLIERGELPSVHVGRRRLLRVADIQKFLAKRKVKEGFG
jgi:excisionase family DNA binding protein